MKSFSQCLNWMANWKTLILFLLTYLIFPAYLLKNAEIRINELSGKTVGVIDLTFGFNPQKTLDMVADYSAEARAYYAKIEMTVDILYPIIYAFLFAIILSLLFRNKKMSIVNLLPFAAMLFDFSENIFIINLLHNYPAQSIVVATGCEIFKLLKWSGFALIILLIAYGIFLKILKGKVNTEKKA